MAVTHQLMKAGRPRVWHVLADGWTYTTWVVGASHMRAVDPSWPAVGARLHHASGPWPLAVRDETVVHVCEPQRRLVLTARGRPFGEARIVLELDDTGEGCRVTMREEPVSGPGRWLHNRVLDALLLHRNIEALARLAAVVEARHAPQD